jgi:hypothetical protein
MRDIDISEVDQAALVDIDDVRINTDLPKHERMADMANQMNGNLYFFKCKRRDGNGYITVKTSFADTPVSLDERMESYMRTL